MTRTQVLRQAEVMQAIAAGLPVPPLDPIEQQRDALHDAYKSAANALGDLPGVGSGTFGLTPDSVKETPAYREAKHRVALAFAALRHFNRTNPRPATAQEGR